MADCLFCRIAQGVVPTHFLYEDEVCCAFPDISPQAPSHFLVIPKVHLSSMAQVSEHNGALVGHLFAVLSKLAAQQGLESYRIVSNTGEQAGQTVPHLHIHVLGGRDMTWPPG